jgi:hypothetical protein|tara:strand:+ start:1937 stop:2392 length:456 start_codon:yes stop_codon:yes gene_type:complete
MIYVKDNILSDNDIEKIKVFYTHPHKQFDQSIVVDISPENEIVQKIKNKITADFNSNLTQFDQVDWSQIIAYPTGSSKGFHLDDVSEMTTGTSITFLNDDIIGGEAVVEGVQITPVKGRTYFIDGKIYKHSVLNVIKGTRITLTSWYKRNH